MEQAIPCTAVLIQRELLLQDSGIPAFDVNATCLGAVVALDIAASAIALGRYRRVLVVSSEIASCGLNHDDTHTAALFGDGAAAFIVGEGDAASAMLASRFETYSEGADLCQVRAGGTRLRVENGIEQWRAGAHFEMSGRATYRMAAQRLPGFIERLLGAAGVQIDDLAAIVPHQASGKALGHLECALKIPAQKLVRVLQTRGNQISASLPIALDHARKQAMIARGDLFAMIGSGAGLSFGGVVLRY